MSGTLRVKGAVIVSFLKAAKDMFRAGLLEGS